MSPDLSPCTNEFGRERLASAESYIEAAETIAESDDILAAARFKNNTIITNYIHAGIAASDAICCFELKAHSKGDDHRQATAQLRKVQDGASIAKALADLLSLKTKAGYGAEPLPDTDVKRAARAANKLV
ncbi:MAG: hypothetical protein QOD52_706 [Gaiellaceae bacterium]|jgi:hypothetical protein|nr:hypothetical protein [Gaiellaceae bacterium]